MTDFYFANQVFVTSVKDFDPYLSLPTGSSNVQKDDDVIASPAFHQVFSSFYEDLETSDSELHDFFLVLAHPSEDLVNLTLLLLHDIRSVVAEKEPRFASVLSDKGIHYYKLVNSFFHYWMRLARFAYLDDQGKEALSSLKPRMLFLRKSVFHIYNALKSHVLEKSLTLETDFSAGFLAGFTTDRKST